MCARKGFSAEVDCAMNVVAYGMCTSLGTSAKQSCAAYRAGLTRAEPVDIYEVADAENKNTESLICSQVPVVTKGFSYDVRLKILIAHALEDIWTGIEDNFPGSNELNCFLVLANANRLQILPPEDGDYSRFSSITISVPSDNDIRRAEKIFTDAQAMTRGGSCSLKLTGLYINGYTGIANALRTVEQFIQTSDQPAMIVCVDSLVNEETVSWLEQWGRLRSPENPAGLQPAEAATCLLISPNAAKSNSTVQISVGGFSEEHHHQLSGENARGEALATLLSKSTNSSDCLSWVVTDQNGEYYRGMEWGNTLVQAERLGVCSERISSWQPAESYGDTGVASASIAICNVVRAIERGYAPSNSAIVLCSDELQERAGIALKKLH